MSKYLVNWEIDMSKIPDDAQERIGVVMQLIEATKASMADGRTADWGQFVGGNKGYGISEKDATETFKNLQLFAPYVKFDVQEVISIDQVEKAVQELAEAMKQG